MSISETTDFDAWLRTMFARVGPFTALIVLVRIAEPRVELLRSTHLHVIGDEVAWPDLLGMFAGAGVAWDGAAFFPTQGAAGGPAPDGVARGRLRELEEKLRENRLLLNDGAFFDAFGRSLRIDEVPAQRRLDG